MTKRKTVIKQDPHGSEVWRWEGEVLEEREGFVLLRAIFNGPPDEDSSLPFNAGDHLIESYYADRWYNIFEVHEGDGEIKGWYCNLSLPAQIGEDEIHFRDLALDLVVFPDGRQEELDWDEFKALEISAEQRRKALEGWDALRQRFANLHKKDPR